MDYDLREFERIDFQLSVFCGLAESVEDQREAFRRLYELLHFGCLQDGFALEHRGTRHSVLHNHTRYSSTLRDRSRSTVCASNERSFGCSHRNVVTLTIHEDGSYHSNWNRNVSYDRFAVVTLFYNRESTRIQ